VSKYHGKVGVNTIGRVFDIPWGGGQNIMGRRVDIPLLRGTTYHGYGGQNGMGSISHG
jgi:hypothetical protein